MLGLHQGTGEEVFLVVGSTLEHRKYLWMLDSELTSESPGKLVATDSGPHSRRF